MFIRYVYLKHSISSCHINNEYTGKCIQWYSCMIYYTIPINTLLHIILCYCTVPVWLSVEQGTGWVDKHSLIVYDSLVALLGILAGCITEEARANGLLHFWHILPTWHHIQLVPNKQHKNILKDELSFPWGLLNGFTQVCNKWY